MRLDDAVRELECQPGSEAAFVGCCGRTDGEGISADDAGERGDVRGWRPRTRTEGGGVGEEGLG